MEKIIIEDDGKLFHLRKAVPGDYQAVVKMNPSEYDFITYAYFNFLHDPTTESWLLEHKGQPVCYAALQRMPHDASMMGWGGRCHPQYRGTGLYDIFTGTIIQQTKDRYPEIEVMYAVFFKNANTDRHVSEGTYGSELINSQKILDFDVQRQKEDISKSLNVPNHKFGHRLKFLDPTNAHKVLTDKGVISELFLNKPIIAGEGVGNLMKTSIKSMNYVAKTHSVCICENQNSGHPRSLSTVHLCMVGTGKAFAIMVFYGKTSEDLSHHVEAHIRNCAISPPFLFEVVFPLTFDEKEIEATLRPILGAARDPINSQQRYQLEWPFSKL